MHKGEPFNVYLPSIYVINSFNKAMSLNVATVISALWWILWTDGYLKCIKWSCSWKTSASIYYKSLYENREAHRRKVHSFRKECHQYDEEINRQLVNREEHEWNFYTKRCLAAEKHWWTGLLPMDNPWTREHREMCFDAGLTAKIVRWRNESL